MKKFLVRTLECPVCKERGLPVGGETLAIFNGSQFFVVGPVTLIDEKRFAGKGFTPHLIEDIRINNKKGTVSYITRCTVNGCGYILKEKVIANQLEYENVELLFKDNLINFQAHILQLSVLLDRLSQTGVKEVTDGVKEIKDGIYNALIHHSIILSESFSPGQYQVFPAEKSTEKRYEAKIKDWNALSENKNGLFPKVFKEI